uniref:Uncharacterized protein n=1 Tax=Timema poppense TaxID=170557 RepID=A0A7R9H2F2_TIMPO|nr:unnamed protein product [Timema poppensis]
MRISPADSTTTKRAQFKLTRMERDKIIPVLASLRYGRPCLEQLEFNDGQHKMKDNLNDFCRRFGLSISPDLEPKCEMITINKCNI